MRYMTTVFFLLLSASTSVHAADSKACAQEWERFERSGACFAPYRLAGGGIKPEAFKHCTEVPMPTCPNPTAPSTERQHPPPGSSQR